MAAPGPDLLKPRNGEDAHVGSGIQFLSSVGYSHPFGVRDPRGTHSIWSCPFLLGLTSSEMVTSEIFHVAPRARPVILRLSGGELLRRIPLLQLGLRWSQAVSDIPSPLRGSFSFLSVSSWGFVLVSSSSEASFSFFLTPASFLLCGRVFLLR